MSGGISIGMDAAKKTVSKTFSWTFVLLSLTMADVIFCLNTNFELKF